MNSQALMGVLLMSYLNLNQPVIEAYRCTTYSNEMLPLLH